MTEYKIFIINFFFLLNFIYIYILNYIQTYFINFFTDILILF